MSYSTMSNGSLCESGIVIKVTIERGKSEELRRIRGSFTFDQVSDIIRHMWNSAPKNLYIEYVDDDGDRIRVGSQLEWTEAVQQSVERGNRTLRVFARRQRRQSPRAASASESDCDDGVPEGVPPLSGVEAQTVHAPQPEAEVFQSEANLGHREPSTEGTEDHENTIDLLSRLFDCDAAKEIVDVFSIVNFAPIVTRKVDAVAQEVQVDVDKAAMHHLTVSRTNLWIGSGLYEKAESTLAAAMRVWPADTIFEYNAACSAALRGDVPKAIELLRAAVHHGYKNVQQMKRDPDLAHARDHPDFSAILSLARGENQTPPEADAPTTTPAEVTPASSKPVETDVDRLISVFPHMTVQEAERVLKRYGNLTFAVNHLLTSV